MSNRLPEYVYKSNTGIFRYRRTVPEAHREALGVREIKKTLGKDYPSAMRRYAVVHKQADEALQRAAAGTPATTRDEVIALLRRAGVTATQLELLISGAAGEDLREGIAALAGELEYEFLSAEDAGRSPRVSIEAIKALNAGKVPLQTYTVSSALDFYVAAKESGDPAKDRQLTNRVNDLRKRMIDTIGKDAVTRRPLSSLTRQDAQRIRDTLLAQVSPNSVKRMLTIVKAAVAMTIRENQLDIPNRFERLEIKGAGESKDDREPFTEEEVDLLDKVMVRGEDDPLSILWVALRDTGARPKELCTLRVSQVFLGESPHLYIKDGKNKNATREVPLSPAATDRLAKLVEGAAPGDAVFPNYAEGRGTDSASAALMKRLRNVITDSKKVVYSLRHRMKDRLRDTGCPEALQREIMGHSGQGIAANYGKGHALALKREALSKVWKD